MFEVVTSLEGDTIDRIAFARFGTHGMETAILEANPGIADLGPVLPLGTKVKIPVPVTPARTSGQNLWGLGE